MQEILKETETFSGNSLPKKPKNTGCWRFDQKPSSSRKKCSWDIFKYSGFQLQKR